MFGQFSWLLVILMAVSTSEALANTNVKAKNKSLQISRSVVDKALASPGLPKKEFMAALQFMSENQSRVRNRNFVALADYSKSITTQRLFIINLKTGAVSRFHVTHGKGSDPRRTGVPQRFSNQSGSLATSLGFYVTKNAYTGKYGYSLRLEGLSKTNNQAARRAVVLHPYYVGPDYQYLYQRHMGKACVSGGCLTEGCLGVSPKVAPYIVDHLKGGALIYAFK